MSPAPNADRASIYLSFADEDRPRVMQLARWLNDGGWEVRADDRHAFAAGEDWGRAAAKRLNSCDIILCVITPGWLVSTYCHREYTYCAKRGKFVLPVLYEVTDLALLPEGIRALPRVDLTQGRMADYLALKDVLTQAGWRIGRVAAAEPDAARKRMFAWAFAQRRSLWLLAAALLLGSLAAIWFLMSG